MGKDEPHKVKASYHISDEKHRDKNGTFLESKHVGFDNPVYCIPVFPKLTEFVIETYDGKKQKAKQCCDSWDVDDHRIPIEVLFKRYGTHPDRGLTSDMVKKNQEKYGRNKVVPPKKPSEFIAFWKNVLFGLNLLLWLCGVANIATYVIEGSTVGKTDPANLHSGIALILVVLISGCFSYYQEYKSNRIFASFRKITPHKAVVWRDAKRQEVNAQELVVGDIIEVKYGDRVPADIRIIESQGFKVDNCLLSGEPQPQNRRPTFTDKDPLESKNLIFFSTNAIAGSAKGVVLRVGDETYMGRLASLANSMNDTDTPLAMEMRRIIKVSTGSSILFGLIFFVVALSMNYSLVNSLFFVIGIVVANVPENLSITLTIQLALIAKKMAKKNCIVKHLHAVDALGSVSVICTETGTLTQGKMSVAHLWFNDTMTYADTKECARTGVGYDLNDLGFNAVIKIATLCSRAKFKPGQDHLPILTREVEGDASEAAILKYVESLLPGNTMKYRDRHPKMCEIPFNSVNKFQVSIHDMKDPTDPRYFLVMKGAPEPIVSMCTTILINNQEYPLDDAWKKRIYDASVKLGKLAERVLGFCDRRLCIEKFPRYHLFDSEAPDFLTEGFRFVGLLSMIDPPKVSVPQAVGKCKTAGIQVVMITGEHPITATAMAKAVGIISEDVPVRKKSGRKDKETVVDIPEKSKVLPLKKVTRVISGAELKTMMPDELDAVLRF